MLRKNVEEYRKYGYRMEHMGNEKMLENLFNSFMYLKAELRKRIWLEIIKFNKSHDRFLFIDKDCYHIGASLKDLGKKWFAFSKLDSTNINIRDKLN